MIDKEHLNYIVKEINKNINKPYIMSNNDFANLVFENLVFIFPKIKMVHIGSSQAFYLTEKSKKYIEKMIEKHIMEHKKRILEYEKNLNELREVE